MCAGGGALAIFCFCATCTHIFSALGHVYPDSHVLVSLVVLIILSLVLWNLMLHHVPQEKMDHVGIIALILGTPITALLVSPAIDFSSSVLLLVAN